MDKSKQKIEAQIIRTLEAEVPMPIVDRVAINGSDVISEVKLYEENAKVTAIFWEWRHKVLTHFFGVSGALIAVTGWLYYASGDLRPWHCVPLLLAAAYSFISYDIDNRHTLILCRSYAIAAGIELQARKQGAIFNFIHKLHYTDGSLTQILHRMYRRSAWLFVGLSILVFVLGTWRWCLRGS